MTCAKCSSTNRDTRRYCGQCGERLLAPCAHCSFPNHRSERFCGGCGHSLDKTAETSPPRAPGPALRDDLLEVRRQQEQKRARTEEKAPASQEDIDRLFGTK